MMNPEQAFQLVRETLVARLAIEPDDIELGASMRDDLGIDSMDALEFASAIESEAGITISDETLWGLRTVQDTVDLVVGRHSEDGEA
ncbi:MAG: acyl carrier protein [Bifidobacteriaceae bacterium]|jgi:acyl carrier protein|nr:acyl carrier protein [Bifidobacteriaceae bacterium]